ncbi:phosphodiester glycosidase family protein [Myroides sp. LoEW2-1]|uniref:phosphodiester glycosidase family protein n=1 Tax=Myroides sp. LoEW2-1 TaxID=2683192 RepID=UPI00132B9949|nr:phosphodiester glycosidase family protein [Myroides sp. LoEW2-1]MVX36066.1 phosphodiester glycosidase family protein [Myroides sp. LoEW2-1]
MKAIKFLLFTLFISLQVSCQTTSDDNYTTYKAVAKTDRAKQLIENTNLVAQVFKDSTYTLTEGVVVHEFDYLSQKGLAMKTFVYDIDLNRPDVSVVASLPDNQPKFAMQPMTAQATALLNTKFDVIGGVNGDFYDMTTGVPRGVFVFNGMVLKDTYIDRNEGFLAVDKNNKVYLQDIKLFKENKDNYQHVVSGGVWLVKDAELVKQSDETVHPRTAIGTTKDNHLLLMVVDGRNYTWSNGMDYTDLGVFMKAIGAEQALNFDGGGSSTFFINPNGNANEFLIRNLPADNGGKERAVANGVIITKAK